MKKQLLICAAIALTLSACGGGGGAAGTAGNGGSILPAGVNPAETATTGSISTSGTILGLGRNVFILNTGSPHGMINVTISASTSITGGALTVGEAVNVVGTGSWSTSIAATSVQAVSVSSPSASASPSPVPTIGAEIPVPSGVISTSGTIVYVTPNLMVVNQGLPHGKVDVTLNSATVQIGVPALNEYVELTGSGSPSTSITATVATYYSSAPSAVSVSGTVSASASYGFKLNVGSASVPVVVTPASVVAGAMLAVGSTAKVVGVGTSTSSVTATQIVVTDPTPTPGPQASPTPTPGPIAQTHLLSSDYLGTPWGTTTVAYAQAAAYLTWAQTAPSNSTAIRASGIKTMLYTDPNHVQATDPMYTGNASTFAQTCAGERITMQYDGITQYIMNVESSSLWSLYNSVIQSESAGTTFDAVFEDNVGTLEAQGLTTFPCSYSDSGWLAGEDSLAAASPYPVFFNGLSGLNGESPSLTVPMASAQNMLGGVFEHCYSDEGTPEQVAWLWQAVENTEIQVTAQNRDFLCMLRDTDDASENTAARIYALASFLLTYNPQTSIIWEEYSTPSGLHVMPEQGLVVLNPTNAAPASIAALQTSSGVYGRQYNDCYLKGSYVGPCAIAVNSSEVTETFPYPQYTHTLAISGEGVLDGGQISTNGASAPTTMAAGTAAIAFP